MVLAFATSDHALLRRALDDRIAEPARAPLLPGFSAAKRAALGAGALGCSISGSGPSAFAFASDEAAGSTIGAAMKAAYEAEGVAMRGSGDRDQHDGRQNRAGRLMATIQSLRPAAMLN